MTSQISNPISTGNAGGTYETRVQAAHLLAMVLGIPLAGLPDHRVVSVTYQARVEGVETDDLVCMLESPYEGPRRRLIQIKRTLEATAGNTPFRQSISRAWSDYTNPNAFQQTVDSISIVCDYQAGVSTREAKTIVDFARSSLTVEGFLRKIRTPRFSSDACRETYSEIKVAIAREVGHGVTSDDEQVFRFLQHLYFQNYELASESGEFLSALLGLIEQRKSAETSAHAIWSQIVQFCAELNQQAGSVSLSTWNSLAPPSLTSALSPRPSEATVLAALHGRTELMEGSIQDQLPNGSLIERSEIFADILDSVRATPLTVVVGDAGVGKSAMMKRASKILGADGFVLFFKAEDFDHTSLHAALASLGTGNPGDFLRFNLAMGQQNLIFIDGVEKVVEFSSREAFVQLLAVLRQNQSWRLCVTVRSHAVQPLCDGLFMGLPYRFVKIPPLTDEELDLVVSQAPFLNPITNTALRSVLRIPFYLKLAIGQAAGNAQTLPTSANQLKRVLWTNAVTKPLEARDGMPARRRNAFKAVCFERAQRVVQYVSPPDDSAAVFALVRDQILLEDHNGMVAPAHDIFDDWALTEIIETAAQDCGQNWPILFEKLGLHPGVRRAFRRWVAEDVDNASSNSAAVLEASLADTTLPQQWRDDAVVGMLQSTGAPSLIARYEPVLVANQHAGLKRMVHLLRVACRAPSSGVVDVPGGSALQQVVALRHIFTAPSGDAWLPTISLIHRHVSELRTSDAEWVAQLLNDSVSLLLHTEADPTSSHESAILALSLLRQQLEEGNWYYGRDITETLLDLLLTFAGGAPQDVQSFLDGVIARYQNEEGDRDAKEILGRCIDGYHSARLCQHLPNLVVKIFNAIVYKTASDDHGWPRHLDISEYFGVSSDLSNRDYFPASAFQGPFLFLLRCHPYIGARLVVDFCNRAAEAYSRSELGNEVARISAPFREDGELIFSYRLWGLYRGMQVGPELLCSALMALEKFLLTAAQNKTPGLDLLLEYILENGNSALTVSVLTSVITAYPIQVTEKLIGILRVPELFQADIARRAGEGSVQAGQNIVSGMSSSAGKFHWDERQTSNKETHRQHDLEHVAFLLQFSEYRETILSILDGYYGRLPQTAEQTEQDRRWRLALHRMDSRQTKLGQETDQGVVLEPLPPPDDLQPMVNQGARQFAIANDAARVQLWALSHFSVGKVEHRSYVRDWREALRILRDFNQNCDADNFLRSANIDALVAAALLQSYLEEIDDETQWVAETTLKAVCEHADSDDYGLIVSKNLNDGARFSAYVLPRLLNVKGFREATLNALATVLTHAVYEMRECAAAGVNQHLWQISPVAAESCVASMLLLAKAVDAAIEGAFDKRQEAAHAAVLNTRERLSDALVHAKWIKVPQMKRLPHTWTEPIAAFTALSYEHAPRLTEAVARNFITLILEALADDEQSTRRRKHVRDVNYELRHTVLTSYANCLLRMQQLDASDLNLIRRLVEEQPEVSIELVRALISAQDKHDNAVQFWAVWDKFFDACLVQLSLDGAKQRRYLGDYEKLIQAILFQKTSWRDDAKSWPAFRQRHDFLTRLPAKLIETSAGFEALCTLLAGIGQETLLPHGLIRLDSAIRQAGGNFAPLESKNVVLEMEIILREVVVSSTSIVRANAPLKEAILRLLDELVNVGSSIAFQLRDYLATPTLA